jgi:hypothetical protein
MPVTHSARLVVWGNAWLMGATSLDEAQSAVCRDGRQQRVLGLGHHDPASIAVGLGVLRGLGAQRLKLVLPIPGDVVDLPAGTPFAVEAAAAHEGVIAVDGAGAAIRGVVPRQSDELVVWQVTTLQRAPVPSHESLADAERELMAALRTGTEELLQLDVARWRPDVADALEKLRDGRAGEALAPGYPERAHRVATLARRISTITDLAFADEGGSTTSREARERDDALRRLSRAARHAEIAACNAVLEPGYARAASTEP